MPLPTWKFTTSNTPRGALITHNNTGFVYAGKPGGGAYAYVCHAERRTIDGHGWVGVNGWGDTAEEAEANARNEANRIDAEGRN